VHTKITGGYSNGVDRYNILNSVIESAKKQDLNILSVLSGKTHFNFFCLSLLNSNYDLFVRLSLVPHHN